MNNQCVGIVLKQQDYKDNDMILTILSKEYGKLSLLAKGIKKASSKNASSCALFVQSVFYFHYRETSRMQTLKTAERKHMFFHLYDDLEKQVIAAILCEMSEKIECEDGDYLYTLLLQCLKTLDEGHNDYGVLAFFCAKMNEIAGISPNVDGCVFCGDPHHIIAVSLYDGGFVCTQHYDVRRHIHLSQERLRYFRLFHKAGLHDYPVLEKIKVYSYEDIEMIVQLFQEHSGIHLKGMQLLQEIITFKPIE
ncbi:MAG: DNA repair protein RecO [Erysipelotrichia bacterium]|nr:DNA repair protein RecO [Erysipelotrichia bacterium]NCC54365.1 DNA repair protein RecO [Erysipelotrichia bacterium]